MSTRTEEESGEEKIQPLLDIGTKVGGRYRIVRFIAAGGMGQVYEAVDDQGELNKAVAIKILHPDHARSAEVRKRFLVEARAAVHIRHPNIVDVTEIGQHDGELLFIVLELLDGEPLANAIAGGKLTLPEILDIFEQSLDGLEAAHKKEIVHRDLKPDNIFLTKGLRGARHVKLLDFGIARVKRNTISGQRTQTGAVMGTPHYMSPEQLLGEQVDRRTDIWAMGVILHEMLTGIMLFDAETPTGIFAAATKWTQAGMPLAETIPAELAAIIRGCLRINREQRYASVTDVKADVLQLMEKLRPSDPRASSLPSGAVPTLDPPPGQEPPQPRRSPQPIATNIDDGWQTHPKMPTAKRRSLIGVSVAACCVVGIVLASMALRHPASHPAQRTPPQAVSNVERRPITLVTSHEVSHVEPPTPVAIAPPVEPPVVTPVTTRRGRRARVGPTTPAVTNVVATPPTHPPSAPPTPRVCENPDGCP